jgi:hypothetical protein
MGSLMVGVISEPGYTYRSATSETQVYDGILFDGKLQAVFTGCLCLYSLATGKLSLYIAFLPLFTVPYCTVLNCRVPSEWL